MFKINEDFYDNIENDDVISVETEITSNKIKQKQIYNLCSVTDYNFSEVELMAKNNLNEDFYDNLDQVEISTDDYEEKPVKKNVFNEGSLEPDGSHKYILFNSKGQTMEHFTYKDLSTRFRKVVYAVNEYYNDICHDYVFGFYNGNKKIGVHYVKDNTEISLEDFIKQFIDLLYTSPKGSVFFSLGISFNTDVKKAPSYNKFKGLLTLLLDLYIYLHQENSSINYGADFNYVKMTLRYDSRSGYEADMSILYNTLYDIKTDFAQTMIKPVKTNFKYTGPAVLSPQSKKRLKDFQFGDILFADKDGNLSGGNGGTPIAICLRTPKDKNEVRFMAIRNISLTKPEIGGKENFINFGMNGCDVSNLKTMQDFYDYINNLDNFIEDKWSHGHLKSNILKGALYDRYVIAPIINATYRFSPLGTKKGQWFIPSVKDYKECLINIKNSTLIIADALEAMDLNEYNIIFNRPYAALPEKDIAKMNCLYYQYQYKQPKLEKTDGNSITLLLKPFIILTE